MRGHLIDFSSTNIVHFLSNPHYNNIKGTCLEEEVDFYEVARVLTADKGATWQEFNRMNSN